MGSSPKAPQPTTEELAAQRRQNEQLIALDQQENERIKRLKRSRYSVNSNAIQAPVQRAQTPMSMSTGTTNAAPRSSGRFGTAGQRRGAA